MRTYSHIASLAPEHKIEGVLSNVDDAPVMRLGDLSLMLTWDQLRKLHAECIKLEVTRAKEAA